MRRAMAPSVAKTSNTITSVCNSPENRPSCQYSNIQSSPPQTTDSVVSSCSQTAHSQSSSYIITQSPYTAQESHFGKGKTKQKLIAKEPLPCAMCKRKIDNKHLLHALDKFWHERCLKCDFCRKPLYKFGNRFYFRQGAKFCQEDFLRTFGERGVCSMCDQPIPPTEYVLRFKGELVYHLDCFKCSNCRIRFCVGDAVSISNPKNVLCRDCTVSVDTQLQPMFHPSSYAQGHF